MTIIIPTEPIGSIPRPVGLIDKIERLGSDDTSTTRDKAFAKIRARVEGTALAAKKLGAS